MPIFVVRPDDPEPDQLLPDVLPKVCSNEPSFLHRSLIYLWVLPTSLFALPVMACNLLYRDSEITYWHGLVEVNGPVVRRILALGSFRAAAMTLGHVILCYDEVARQKFRAHELVHVQQAEKWGPLFLPLYLLHAFMIWRKTGNPYWEHPWEVEARSKSGI
ncbi:MAG: hypothetical protein RJA81_1255 [Planctomycetota bacterium]